MTDELVVNPINSGMPENAESSQTEVQVGVVLLAARKAKSLTQQDVSNTLRFSIKQIDALEHDDFSVLPDAMITRGFIRNYARLLGLDAEPLLVSYKAQVPDKSPNALSVKSSMHQVVSSKKRLPWVKYSLVGVLLFCLLALFLYVNYMPRLAGQVTEKTHEVVPTPAPMSSVETPLPELALPVAERQVDSVTVGTDAAIAEPAKVLDNTVSAVNASNASNVSTTSSSVAEANSVNQKNMQLAPPPAAVDFNTLKASTARVATQSGQVATSQVQAAASIVATTQATLSATVNTKANVAVSTKKVNISATERSWVSVTDKFGKVIFEKMLTAGSDETFEAAPPMNAVVGNVKATKLVLSGKPVDLAVTTKSNVAHLVLE